MWKKELRMGVAAADYHVILGAQTTWYAGGMCDPDHGVEWMIGADSMV